MATQVQKARKYGLTEAQFKGLKTIKNSFMTTDSNGRGIKATDDRKKPMIDKRVINSLLDKNLIYWHIMGYLETTRKGDVTLNSIKEQKNG